MTYLSYVHSPVGRILLASNGDALTGLWLEGQKYCAATVTDPAEERDLPVFAETRKWLDCYFSGKIPPFAPPLAPEGTPFRRAVWKLLLTIPYGETTTYGTLAARYAAQYGRTTSARAVGNAVGHNPVSVIIPCHRVLGADGSLTGYAGGKEKKQFLLDLESAAHRE